MPTQSLFRRGVGMHGFGAIARALVDLLRPFGVKLSAYSAGVPEEVMTAVGMAPVRSLEALFQESDVLIECEALTAASAGLVSRDVLKQLPNDALFVNVGRGAVVDEEALRELAAAARIRVATDVPVHEPPPPESLWWKIRDALISPHIGGPTRDYSAVCGAFALANIRGYFAGEPLEAQVTPGCSLL